MLSELTGMTFLTNSLNSFKYAFCKNYSKNASLLDAQIIEGATLCFVFSEKSWSLLMSSLKHTERQRMLQ